MMGHLTKKRFPKEGYCDSREIKDVYLPYNSLRSNAEGASVVRGLSPEPIRYPAEKPHVAEPYVPVEYYMYVCDKLSDSQAV